MGYLYIVYSFPARSSNPKRFRFWPAPGGFAPRRSRPRSDSPEHPPCGRWRPSQERSWGIGASHSSGNRRGTRTCLLGRLVFGTTFSTCCKNVRLRHYRVFHHRNSLLEARGGERKLAGPGRLLLLLLLLALGGLLLLLRRWWVLCCCCCCCGAGWYAAAAAAAAGWSAAAAAGAAAAAAAAALGAAALGALLAPGRLLLLLLALGGLLLLLLLLWVCCFCCCCSFVVCCSCLVVDCRCLVCCSCLVVPLTARRGESNPGGAGP